ncbi:MAG: Phosphopantetheine adenylyltransferase [Alphaproteobacteria bacterium MarineAlpha5_Bin2]|jgi:pantetheine-phosphate adenylyltransferase|nr:pantetheine-phosphate adenylyltransferase [Alphaproteobacteria bacterium]PPR54251.1 MAG: Phosphopantetheine adenylyltransferase [Alphaproteobacteria bacterium MarineAlpha5_Bin2]PPR57269.1 MAG: Phosphopantetheine adenylyltransferase [Alphaproteobacteria bacterium MarineAlpha5_Bin3]
MKNKIGIYPGTFDPLTYGHLDIIRRSLKIVDNLIIGIADNDNKKPLFSLDERKEIIQNDLKDLISDNENVFIKNVKGLLTDFAKSNEATCIIRGLRAVSDFEYEFQMTGMNYQLNPQIETIFLMTSDQKSFISSNLVKEVHKLGGNVSSFVTNNTIKVLDEKNTRS